MTIAEHAVVVGRSMAGLGAAASLARHFERVTIVDKDAESTGGEPRTGVGQGRHLHNLLKGGENSIETLLPGAVDELSAAGAVELPQSIGFQVFDHGQWLPERDLGFSNLSASRGLIEHTVLQRLLREPNVEIRHRRSVSGLMFNEQGSVEGVDLSSDTGSPEILSAALVVDATGLVSKSPGWLEAAGYGPVPAYGINIGLSYTSAVFSLPDGEAPGFTAMAVIPSPPNKRGAFIAPIENDRWLVSLHTRFEQDLPTSHDEMTAFASGIEIAEVADFLANAVIDGPVRSYRKRDATWRRYDKLDRFPEGLLVLGDAMTSFNPVYGQGMSVAWLQAVALDEILTGREQKGAGLDGLAGDFFPVAAQISRNAWNGSTLVDSAYEEVTGDMRPGTEGDIAFMAGLRTLLTDDPELHADYIGVGQMTTPVEALVTPDRVERAVAAIQHR